MTWVIRKGLVSSNDVKWYTAASPTFYRGTSSGGGTTLNAIAATHIPLSNATASYWTVDNVERAIAEAGGYIRSSQATVASHTTQFTNAHATIASHTTKHTSAEATIKLLNAASVNWAYWYRCNKPQMSHTLYSVSGTATRVVSCYGSTTAPSEVMINGVVYRNKGTILCDFSRTKIPSQATVGGFDRGPSVATYAHYLYAVPTTGAHLSATRQWDLIVSKQSPATGPLASATYASWSFLGAVNTHSSGAMIPFKQNGNEFMLSQLVVPFLDTAPVSYMATYRNLFSSNFPVSSQAVMVEVVASAGGQTNVGGNWYVQDGDLISLAGATAEYSGRVCTLSIVLGAGVQVSLQEEKVVYVKPSASRYIGYRFGGVAMASATNVSVYLRMRGHVSPREQYK